MNWYSHDPVIRATDKGEIHIIAPGDPTRTAAVVYWDPAEDDGEKLARERANLIIDSVNARAQLNEAWRREGKASRGTA